MKVKQVFRDLDAGRITYRESRAQAVAILKQSGETNNLIAWVRRVTSSSKLSPLQYQL
jgi:hypothetical protein